MKRSPNFKLNVRNSSKKKKHPSKNKYHFNIKKGGLIQIYSFFNLKDQILFTQINQLFRNSLLTLLNISENETNSFFKYIFFLFNIEDKAENYAPYINVFLDINVINFARFKFGKINQGKIKALIYFLNYRYKLTNNKHFFLDIQSMEDYYLNQEIILSLDNYKNLKYHLRLFKELNIEETINLFKQIPNVYCLDDEKHISNNTYAKIQDYILTKEIEAYHYKINNSNMKKAISYFKKYPNHLFSISDKKNIELIENNYDSIYKYDSSEHTNLLEYPNLKLKKIKFYFSSESFNENFGNLNLNLIENIGGFIINDEEESEEISKKFKECKNLKKLNNLQFGEEDNPKLLFDFLKRINNLNIESFTLWYNRLSVHKNGLFQLLNIFPKIRQFFENSDSSGRYDEYINIYNCYSSEISKSIYSDNNNLDCIIKIIKNYLNHQVEGRKFIKFDLYCDQFFTPSLIKYAYDNNEDNIINSIYSINMIVSNEEFEQMNELKKLNFFEFKTENEVLFNSLENVNKVNLIKISDEDYLNNNFDLIKQFNPDFICFNCDINNDNIQKFKELNSLKFLFTSKENLENIKDNDLNFEIFPSTILTINLEKN